PRDQRRRRLRAAGDAHGRPAEVLRGRPRRGLHLQRAYEPLVRPARRGEARGGPDARLAVRHHGSAEAGGAVMSFWEARFLWQEPMLAAVLGAALCGYLGFFVVLRRIAFMSAALSQVSGLGVAMAFWVGSFAEVTPHQEGTPWYASPALYAIAFACLGAVTMALPSRSKRVSPESIVALAYLASSAGVIMVLSSPRIAQEAHEIGDLLFGNAVVVKHEH